MSQSFLPRILIIDDLLGRTHKDRRNEERANFCGQYLLKDITGDETGKGQAQKIKRPIAEAVFFRGQNPVCSGVGDFVENDLEGCLKIIQEGWEHQKIMSFFWSIVLLDLCFYTGLVTEESDRRFGGMPEGRERDADPRHYFGIRLLETITVKFAALPVIILSSMPQEPVARQYCKKGALGFIPREKESSPKLLESFIWRHGLIPDVQHEIVGHSRSLLIALRTARRAGETRQNILVRGERGTGKGLLARYIHRQRDNHENSPFIEVNSSVLTPELFASELFGIKKGTASGVSERKGLIEEANGGDLFFDEIKDMLPQVQAGILRVLEERSFLQVGSKEPRTSDVRFLSATNVEVEALAVSGEFRTDLLDRLRDGGTVFLPPLRHRKEDIALLVEKFLRQAEQSRPGSKHHEIDNEAMDKLISYSWPGNIRELRSRVFNAVNNYSDVQHLFPLHFEIPQEKYEERKSVEKLQEDKMANKMSSVKAISDISDLIDAIDKFEFQSIKPAELVGKLSDLQGSYAFLIIRYLNAVLEATRKSTPENPEGEILIHPAIKLMTGNSKLSASKASDIIKKLVQMHPRILDLLKENSTISEAYETALRLRPKSNRKKSK